MIGVDEVGRGCWAGPLLVVAARQRTILPIGLKDSKLLSRLQRQVLLDPICQSCDIGEGWVSHQEIDRVGLASAMRLAVERALSALTADDAENIILDGATNYCPPKFVHVQTIPRADSLYPIVSAASIVAKVKRDTYMASMATQYPQYQFEKHVGYGTKLHQELLQQFGVSPIHRLSYKPIQALL